MKKHLDWKRIGDTIANIGLGLLMIIIFATVISIFTVGFYYVGKLVVGHYIDNWLLNWFVGGCCFLALFVIWQVGRFLFGIIQWLIFSIPDVINYYYHNGSEDKHD